jgi:hypothetical protein
MYVTNPLSRRGYRARTGGDVYVHVGLRWERPVAPTTENGLGFTARFEVTTERKLTLPVSTVALAARVEDPHVCVPHMSEDILVVGTAVFPWTEERNPSLRIVARVIVADVRSEAFAGVPGAVDRNFPPTDLLAAGDDAAQHRGGRRWQNHSGVAALVRYDRGWRERRCRHLRFKLGGGHVFGHRRSGYVVREG